MPGIAFLSGGQSDELATAHLNVMNMNFGNDVPWSLTFSYGRALQHSALMAWVGDDHNVIAAQKILYHRSFCNGLAAKGEYDTQLDE